MDEYIKGIFKRSIFKSDKGYVIGLFYVRETNIKEIEPYINKTITITGYFATIEENDNYIIKGEIVEHPKYGFQFNVLESEKLKPDDIDGVIEFLSSDLFKGVGESLAKKIVDTLGKDALNLILEDKNNLYKVKKISDKKVDLIYNTLINYESSHNIIVNLTELGFSMKDALLIFNTYKSNTNNVIENNIYKLLDDIPEISFNKIDTIYKNNNTDLYNINRIEACILHIMNDLTFKTGDTYLTYSEIYNAVSLYLNDSVDSNIFDEAMYELEGFLKVKIDDDKYYLMDDYEAEDYIASKINYLINKEPMKVNNIDSIISELEQENDILYNDDQRLAIKKSIEDNILIITGGPGTGKTTIIKAITQLYKKVNKLNDKDFISNIALLAPTGRASKRMSSSTLLPATTIHRFLKWNKESNEFNVNEYNPDFSNLIIVDEVSMIDNRLMSNLLKGLTNNIKLILVGDYNQLPSVGNGNILKDLIDSDLIDTINLNLLYRQSEDSYIPVLANEIKNDTLDESFISERDDYKFLTCSNSSIVPSLVNIVKTVIKLGYDYKRVQLMAPMYAGVNGIDNLNKVLQDVFNPRSYTKAEVKYLDCVYREGDKVIQLENDPDNNVYNGDIGVIISINHKKSTNEIVIDYDSTIVSYTQKDFKKIKHGFIISVHKSQGSEFELVIMPISTSYRRMLYKKLLYTGVTRAKRKLILIGDAQAFYQGVRKNEERSRKTTLLEKMNIYLNKN